MGCSPSTPKKHEVYVIETDVPDLMAGGSLRNEYETKKNYLDVYGKPLPDDTNAPATEDQDNHQSSSQKSKKHNCKHNGKHGGKHKKGGEDDDEGNDDLDADACIQVDGPQTVNEKQTHAHSSHVHKHHEPGTLHKEHKKKHHAHHSHNFDGEMTDVTYTRMKDHGNIELFEH